LLGSALREDTVKQGLLVDKRIYYIDTGNDSIVFKTNKTKYRVDYKRIKNTSHTMFTLQRRVWGLFWVNVYQTTSPDGMRNCIDSYGLEYK
jgi:hypothetical protein